MAEDPQRIFVVCSDLMFSARIREAGVSPGAVFEFISTAEALEEALENFRAALLMVDLDHPKLGGEAARGNVRVKLPGAEGGAWLR